MGCPCELRFDADSEEAFSRAIEPCLREIRRFEAKSSRYLPESVTSAINRAAGASSVPVDEETASILKYAAVCHEQSDGLFDITSGVFRHVWHPQRTTLPSRQELDACAAKVGWDKVQLSEQEVFLPLPGMELGFGGVVKEYAADAAAVVAGKAGLHHGLINLGGDIRIVGPQADGRPWPIGIVYPLRTDAAIATLSLAEGAVTTSGGYERFVEIGGRRYSHLIDPRSGWPVDGLLSVSVVASQAIIAGGRSLRSRCCSRRPTAWTGSSGAARRTWRWTRSSVATGIWLRIKSESARRRGSAILPRDCIRWKTGPDPMTATDRCARFRRPCGDRPWTRVDFVPQLYGSTPGEGHERRRNSSRSFQAQSLLPSIDPPHA